MASVVERRIEIKPMDINSCLAIDGEYDINTGLCRYSVIINGNGEKEFVKNNGGKKK